MLIKQNILFKDSWKILKYQEVHLNQKLKKKGKIYLKNKNIVRFLNDVYGSIWNFNYYTAVCSITVPWCVRIPTDMKLLCCTRQYATSQSKIRGKFNFTNEIIFLGISKISKQFFMENLRFSVRVVLKFLKKYTRKK